MVPHHHSPLRVEQPTSRHLMKLTKLTVLAAAVSFAAVSCDKTPEEKSSPKPAAAPSRTDDPLSPEKKAIGEKARAVAMEMQKTTDAVRDTAIREREELGRKAAEALEKLSADPEKPMIPQGTPPPPPASPK